MTQEQLKHQLTQAHEIIARLQNEVRTLEALKEMFKIRFEMVSAELAAATAASRTEAATEVKHDAVCQR